MKRIARFALFGAIGFGIGAIGFRGEPIGGWYMHFQGESFPWLPGFAILGALGGGALRLALGDWKKVWVLALVGATGFFAGTIGTLVIMVIVGMAVGTDFRGDVFSIIAFGAMPGAIGGAALGLALWDWRKFIGLALAGALGFGIGMMIMCATPLNPWLGWVLWGIIGGASLGAALGYLEKQKAMQNT